MLRSQTCSNVCSETRRNAADPQQADICQRSRKGGALPVRDFQNKTPKTRIGNNKFQLSTSRFFNLLYPIKTSKKNPKLFSPFLIVFFTLKIETTLHDTTLITTQWKTVSVLFATVDFIVTLFSLGDHIGKFMRSIESTNVLLYISVQIFVGALPRVTGRWQQRAGCDNNKQKKNMAHCARNFQQLHNYMRGGLCASAGVGPLPPGQNQAN